MAALKKTNELCRSCQYYWGECGDWRKKISASLPICGYYRDTGKHRCDDFGRQKVNNEWMETCDKYEAKHQERDRSFKSKPINRKGVELNIAYKKEAELANMKITSVCVCQACGSDQIGTKDSRDTFGHRIRTRYCKDCKATFKTVEVLLDEVGDIFKQEDDGK